MRGRGSTDTTPASPLILKHPSMPLPLSLAFAAMRMAREMHPELREFLQLLARRGKEKAAPPATPASPLTPQSLARQQVM